MGIVVNTIISVIFGLIPESLFFTLFLIYTKNIKEKKVKLFIGIIIAYTLYIMISRFKTLYYILFIFTVYIILKILYKSKTGIIDVFIISLSFIYVCLISFLCSRFINNNYILYYILLIINKILLFLPFTFKNQFNLLYKRYCDLWNRNKDVNRPIKSITLRNISLIILNVFIFILNILTIYVINTFT